MGQFLPLFSSILTLFHAGQIHPCLGEYFDANLGSKQTLLSTALLDLYGIDYVRQQADAWEAAGDTVCATGVMLDKNIYQYNRVFIQLEVRDAAGELVADFPLLFQTSSVQAHDNSGPQPWAGIPYGQVKGTLAGLTGDFSAKHILTAFPRPEDPMFTSAVSAQSFGQGLDSQTFFVTPILASGDADPVYIATWMELVPGTGGSVFTSYYSPKMLLFQYKSDGSVAVDDSQSGYAELLSPLDQELQQAEGEDQVANRAQQVLQFSQLGSSPFSAYPR